MHKHALWYSLDPSITIGQLKKNEVSCTMNTSGLEEWMDKHSLGAVVQDEDAFHYKFLSITQSPYIVYYQ
jgi:hypothetical protein